jgi:hypothetical protein
MRIVITGPPATWAPRCLQLLAEEPGHQIIGISRPALILQAAAASEIARYFLPRPVPVSLLRPGLLRLVPFPAGIAEQFVHARDVARAVLLVLRSLARASWAAHLQPVDPGWIDLAASVPILSTDRIRQLGWRPEHPVEQLLREFLQALRDGRGTASPALAPRARPARAIGLR